MIDGETFLRVCVHEHCSAFDNEQEFEGSNATRQHGVVERLVTLMSEG